MMRLTRLLLCALFGLFLFSITMPGIVPAEENPPTEPEPIKIDRKGGKPTIPDVPRDEVIGFALYTLHNHVLKMSVQFYPLEENESRDVVLEVDSGNGWKKITTARVDENGLATFRLQNWNDSRRYPYRLSHAGGSEYTGVIRENPIDKEEIVVAGFTGNSNSDRSPRTDVVENIKKLDPDLLFFSGDQSYDHKEHTAAWLLFGRQFGEIIKDRPTITIPDDHDVGQGNLWGEGGKVSHLPGGADGGYIMSAEYVNMVQKAQASHLPDPYDPTPIEQDISVYYTNLNWGDIDFAVIEDRKWKTGPAGLIPKQGPRPDHINNPNYDPTTVDVPEARLLGSRQLKFLHEWGQDWDQAEMKVVLSQTIFGGGAHIHGKSDSRLLADLDSNGWPQAGRARALEEIRRCFGFHLAGDQHLATVIHHGVHSWEDSGFSFCVPSIVNYYGRWWWPLEEPEGRLEGNDLPFAGQFYDGFRNKLTMHAYANPTSENFNAAGFGIVRFNKKSRQITMECWPRHVDVEDPDAKQFEGWPIVIQQEDNYARKPLGWLPELQFENATNPVVQVVDEYLDEIVYTIRINGNSWQPPVFREATYTIRFKSDGKTKSVEHIESLPLDQRDAEPLKIRF
ncbi:PhoD-like phosphatase [Polystyrenella longa]|uniref:PhoD-like phosphatase n=1 Tax=Polystyrenella longa TaxID=2528007 RepID=A0A518CQV4_9PLAN|nr:hypothetical protein [Polystyrenella longa]QDU81609.1 PhoD-like phosphatase [Polystyrenella longa]